MRGEARGGEARRGEARRGEARRGEARRGEARRGEETQGKFSYSEVSEPLDCSTRLGFNHWQTCSTEHNLDVSGKIPTMQQLMRKDYSYTNQCCDVTNYIYFVTLLK